MRSSTRPPDGKTTIVGEQPPVRQPRYAHSGTVTREANVVARCQAGWHDWQRSARTYPPGVPCWVDLGPPQDAGPAGQTATCADPAGMEFRLWPAGQRPGAQLVNEPGTWNFSRLPTTDLAAACAFYRPVFGWQCDDVPGGGMSSHPGHGRRAAAPVCSP
jgi:hypothetical protein